MQTHLDAQVTEAEKMEAMEENAKEIEESMTVGTNSTTCPEPFNYHENPSLSHHKQDPKWKCPQPEP